MSADTLPYAREGHPSADRLTVLGLIMSASADAAILVALAGEYRQGASVPDFAWVELLLLASFCAAFVGTGLALVGALRTRRGRWTVWAIVVSVAYWGALGSVMGFDLI